MKRIFMLSMLLFVCTSLHSQPSDTVINSLEDVVSAKVKQAIADNEYVRIPIQDFEDIIENRITTSMDSRIKTLIGFLVAIIGILSTLSIIQSNRSRNILKEQVLAQINSELNAKNLEFREAFEKLINSRLNEVEKQVKEKFELEFKNNMENIRKVETQLEQSKIQIERAEEYLLNIEFEDLRKQIMSGKYVYELTLDRTKNLLANAENMRKQTLIPEIVNLLTYIYYDYKKYNEVTSLLDQYEGKIKFISTSYINAALTAISDYHHFNSYSQRVKAIDYLNKSLELTQGYGQAQALKLEIFMMDHMRSNEEGHKKNAVNDALKVLDDILKSESNAPAYETIQRLYSDSKITAYKKYVDKLYELFPEQLNQIHKKSEQYELDLSKFQNPTV